MSTECGTEYLPTVLSIDVPATGALAIDIAIKRWSDLQDKGWYSAVDRPDPGHNPGHRLTYLLYIGILVL